MRKPTDELFLLIKSMTMGEKIVFRQLAGRHIKAGKTNYLKLYDAIEAQKKYDEEQIKNKVSGQINLKYFPYEKNNLYNLICRSLFFFHTDTSIGSQIREGVEIAKILYHKRLFNQSLKKLAKAKQQAGKYEKFLEEAEASMLERTILGIDLNLYQESIDRRMTLISEERLIYMRLTNILDYNEILIKLLSFNIAFKDDAQKVRSQLAKTIANPLIQNSNKALSFIAKCLYLQINSTSNFINTSYQKDLKILGSLVSLYEENPHRIDENPKPYIIAMTNLLETMSLVEAHGVVLDTFNKIRKMLDEPAYNLREEYKLQRLFKCYIALTNSLIRHKNFNAINDHLKNIGTLLTRNMDYVDNIFCFELFNNISFCLFASGKYKVALPWINMILNNKKLDAYRSDYHSFTRILNIITHYEIGHLDLLDYLIESTERFLEKKEGISTPEKIILKYLKGLLKSHPDKVDLQKFFSIFYKDIHPYKAKDLGEKNIIDVVDVVDFWVARKVSNVKE